LKKQRIFRFTLLHAVQESVVTETIETEPDGFYVFAQLADQESFFAASYRTLFFYTLEFDALKKLTPINLKFRNIVHPTAVIVQ
jgi:hypothetical protein